LDWLYQPWPWYVAGPLIGMMVPMMLFIGNRSFGISNNLRHLCAITQPPNVDVDFFRYNWKEHIWSLVFVIGTALGGFLAGVVFANPEPVAISQATQDMLLAWGFTQPGAFLVPDELFIPACATSPSCSLPAFWSVSAPAMPAAALPVMPSPACRRCNFLRFSRCSASSRAECSRRGSWCLGC
jgi:hypothetical protein